MSPEKTIVTSQFLAYLCFHNEANVERDMRTEHMTDRMRQRRFVEAEIDVIMELGELNERADRLVLTARNCAREEAALRKEIERLEHQDRKIRQ